MSLFGYLGKKAADRAVTRAGATLGNKLGVSNKVISKTYRYTGDDDHCRLVISQDIYNLKETFEVFDSNGNVKYKIKGKIFSLKHKLRIYDLHNKCIAKIREKIFTICNPFSLRTKKKSFVIYIDNKKIGKINGYTRLGKLLFKTTFNKWELDSNFLHTNYKVKNGNEIELEAYKEYETREELYWVDITSEEQELLGLIYVLVVDCYLLSKSQDNYRRNKKIRRKYF